MTNEKNKLFPLNFNHDPPYQLAVLFLPKSAATRREINTFLIQVIELEISFCAASVIFIVLLISPRRIGESLHLLIIGIGKAQY